MRDRIVEAGRFAEVDSYRAATHNKGIMNGIDAVTVATGNDWRGVEAGAHAYAAREGRYRPLSRWGVSEDGGLEGSLELPLAVGTVGGFLRTHPRARMALRILGVSRASDLAMVVAAAGLASNLAALRALACEGIPAWPHVPARAHARAQRGRERRHGRPSRLRAGRVR